MYKKLRFRKRGYTVDHVWIWRAFSYWPRDPWSIDIASILLWLSFNIPFIVLRYSFHSCGWGRDIPCQWRAYTESAQTVPFVRDDVEKAETDEAKHMPIRKSLPNSNVIHCEPVTLDKGKLKKKWLRAPSQRCVKHNNQNHLEKDLLIYRRWPWFLTTWQYKKFLKNG